MAENNYWYSGCRRSAEVNSVPVRCVETGQVWPTTTIFGRETHCFGKMQIRVLSRGEAHTDGRHYERIEKQDGDEEI